MIGNAIPKNTKAELANFGVESRAITMANVLDALQPRKTDEPAAVGEKLIPDDLAKVRYLLSDHGAVTVPEGLIFEPPWNHEKVFLALVKRGAKHKDLWKKNIYVQLYSQRPNCAVLYGPRVEPAKPGPLHLNPRGSSWDESKFLQMKPSIEYVQSDNKGPGREQYNFDWYRIKDWDGFAASLGL